MRSFANLIARYHYIAKIHPSQIHVASSGNGLLYTHYRFDELCVSRCACVQRWFMVRDRQELYYVKVMQLCT